MSGFLLLLVVTLKAVLRDRVLWAVLGVALLLFLLVPAFSLFSMRQVQELALTLSLSAISLTLLVLSIMLGGFAVWRDIERRYAGAVLGLPISRGGYLLGKFAGIAVVLTGCAGLLTLVSCGAVLLASTFYPAELPIAWGNLLAAVVADCLKYLLLAGFALLFSSLSTSFFLPVFGTLAVFFAGSASQGVMEYASGEYGQVLSTPVKALIYTAYYLLPNFSAFDLKVHAVYALPLHPGGLLLTALYFIVYLGILLGLGVWTFSRRELV